MKRSILNQAIQKSLRVKFHAKAGAHRFITFQLWLLETQIDNALHAFLSLFAFDGLRVEDFRSAIKSQPAIYMDGKVGLSWQTKIGRTQRIWLSSITVFLISQCNWGEVQKLTIRALQEIYSNIAGHVQTLEQFHSDQLSWFSEISSGPVFEHFCSRIPMTALSDECYVRVVTKKIIVSDHSKAVDETVERILAASISGFLEPIGEDKNPTTVDRLIQICQRKEIDDRSHHKNWMLNECLGLVEQAVDSGPISCLLVVWACDLIRYGTQAKADISTATITNYVGVLVKPVFNFFKGKNFVDWDATDFQRAYQIMILEITPGQKRNLASALNSWHRFLVNWMDVPHISKQLHDEVPDVPPSANFIWPHEIQLIQQWLTNSSADERLLMYLRGMFCVASKVRIRIGELLKLKISDLKRFENTVEITINGTKSNAAKRRIEVDASHLGELIVLLERRLNENALLTDLLFGDPNQINKIYKLGQLYTFANQLVKAVTGDPTAKFHTTSHSVISVGLSEMLIGGTTSLLNPFFQFSTDVAHSSVLTSCSEYGHLYEDAVRATLNRGLQNLKISSSTASKWAGCQAATLRKRKSNSKIDLDSNCFYWQTIFANFTTDGFINISDAFEVGHPEPPRFLFQECSLDFAILPYIFNDLAKGVEIQSIALRQSVESSEIHRLIQQAKKIIVNGRFHFEIHYRSTNESVLARINHLIGINFMQTNQSKLREVRKNLQRVVLTNDDYRGLQGWLSLAKSGYLSLEANAETRNFLKTISKIGIPVTHLSIAYSNQISPRSILLLQSIFYEVFGVTVPQFLVNKRRGRPSTYLLFSSKRIYSDQMPAPASTSVCGLNALLFIALIFLEGHKNES